MLKNELIPVTDCHNSKARNRELHKLMKSEPKPKIPGRDFLQRRNGRFSDLSPSGG